MCGDHNLGARVRRGHLRVGVVLAGLALALGFGIVDSGLPAAWGWLLVLPLTLGAYCLLAGSFGLCLFASIAGQRHADHGEEIVPDADLRRHLVQRGLVLTGVSCALAVLATAVFVSSV
jgi:hypothetical protein